MVSFKRVCLFATVALAAVVNVRDLNTLLSYFKKIDTDVNRMIAYEKAGVSSGVVVSDLGIIDRDIKSAGEYAGREGPYNSADSQIVVGVLKGSFASDIKTALSIFVNHKSDYAKAGLTSLAKSDLTTLKTDTDSLLNALIRISSSDTKSAVSSASRMIDIYLASAIGAFS